MKKLVIYGISYPDVVKIVDAINVVNPTWEILGFIEDREKYQSLDVLGYSVLGDRRLVPDLAARNDIFFFNNHYGQYADFKERNDFLIKNNCRFASLIHPSIDLNYVKVGQGCLVADGCYLSSVVELGDFVTVRAKSIISHNTKIEDYAMIAPGCNVGSCVTLEEGVFLGTGSVIKRTVTVGKGTTVGCGAVVINDVSANSTVVGVPAKKIKKSLFKKIFKRIMRSRVAFWIKTLKKFGEFQYEKTHN